MRCPALCGVIAMAGSLVVGLRTMIVCAYLMVWIGLMFMCPCPALLEDDDEDKEDSFVSFCSANDSSCCAPVPAPLELGKLD